MGMGLRQLLPPMRGRESGGTQVKVLLQRRQKFLGPDGNRTSSFGVLVFDHLKFKLQVETNGYVFWGSENYVVMGLLAAAAASLSALSFPTMPTCAGTRLTSTS